MPGLCCSPVCLTVLCFLSWSLAPVRTHNGRDEVSGLLYGLLESNVTLACGPSPVRTPVVWRFNHSSALPWHQVSSAGSLVLLHTERTAQGDYSCYDHQGRLVHSLSLRLGYPPGPLSISYRVPNHSHIRISWEHSVATRLPAEYSASYTGKSPPKDEDYSDWLSDRSHWKPCAVDASGRHCDINLPRYWETTTFLKVTETNGLGAHTSVSTFRISDLLKPEPPELVLVESVQGHPTRLQVSWRLPSSWPQESLAFPLTFQLRYRPQSSSYWSELFSDFSPLLILDALGGHVHQVEVRARDDVNTFGHWSEWSAPGFGQPWEDDSTLEPTEELPPEDVFPSGFFPLFTKPETSTAKSYKPALEEEGNVGLVILLVLFSVVILTTVLSLVFVMWVKQRRRSQENKQELSSMVKMKSMSI